MCVLQGFPGTTRKYIDNNWTEIARVQNRKKDVNLGTVMYYLSYHPHTSKTCVLMIQKNYPKWILHSGATFRGGGFVSRPKCRTYTRGIQKHTKSIKQIWRSLQKPSTRHNASQERPYNIYIYIKGKKQQQKQLKIPAKPSQPAD